jgi:hypothetical protein
LRILVAGTWPEGPSSPSGKSGEGKSGDDVDQIPDEHGLTRPWPSSVKQDPMSGMGLIGTKVGRANAADIGLLMMKAATTIVLMVAGIVGFLVGDSCNETIF